MKNKLLLFTFLLTTWITHAQVNVMSTGGSTTFNTYTTLKAAFDSINGGYQTGDIQINITGNTTETAIAKLDSSGKVNSWGTSFYTSIHIQPVGGAWTISGAMAIGNPLIDLNGADSVTFDGTNHFTGDSLTIINTTVSSQTGTCTIRLINDASQNVFKNIVIKGAATTSSTTNGGIVYFATAATGGNGNDNNLIQSCLVTNSNATNSNFPYKLIYLNGTTTNANMANSGNIIDGNYLVNYRANGIYSNTGVKDLTIRNNHLYHTATLVSSSIVFAPIWVSNATSGIGENFIISGNYIGGTQPFCGGTQQIIPLTSVFQVIYLNCATSAISYIHSNTIANMDIGSSSTTANHSYIFLNGGKISCGSLGGNTIGSMTDTANLIFRYTSSSQTNFAMIASAGATTSPVFDTVWIENNTIGGISHRQMSTAGASLRVFDPTGSTATWMIRYNIIGSPTVTHSIRFSGTGNNMFGILNRSTGSNTHYFVGNKYSNLTNNSSGTASGITGAALTGTASWVADSNVFQFITSNSPNTSLTTATATGIRFSPNAVNNISLNGNTVHDIYATNATTATAAIGVDIGLTASATTNTVAGNKIYNIGASTSGTATVIGMRLTTNPTGQAVKVYNNLISLGKDSLGVDITKPHIFYGIHHTRGNIIYNHNSVLISGFNTDTSNTWAFYGVDTGGTYSVVNNVFSNERSHAVVYTARNYAAQFNGTVNTGAISALTDLNHNLYWAPNAAGALISNAGVEYTTIPAWRSLAYVYDMNSVNGSPVFISYTELRGGSASSITTGSINLGISNDIDNRTRNNYLMGAYDYDVAHPVPVKYTTFTATAQKNNALLIWVTASELNNKGFEIQRSFDGENFETINFVSGNVTSALTHRYTYTDINVLTKNGIVYYRLKQLDYDGLSELSSVVVVDRKHNTSAHSIFPNPFNQSFSLMVDAGAQTEATLELVDITGKVVYTKTFEVEQGANTLESGVLTDLNSGIYFARFTLNDTVTVQKVIRN